MIELPIADLRLAIVTFHIMGLQIANRKSEVCVCCRERIPGWTNCY